MGFRFQKRIRIFKGLTLNLSKSGSSWTVGRPGASVNFREDKVTGNVGIPGTGLSYRQSIKCAENLGGQPKVGNAVIWLVLLSAFAFILLR